MLKVLYSFLIKVFYIPYCFIIILRKFLGKEHESKFREKILPKKINRPDGFLFWFHVASMGELISIFPIIDFFLEKNSKYNFLITTVTLSSFNELKKKYKNNNRVFHQFLPYDSKWLINNFLTNWKPDLVSFVDSEIWPNFFLRIKKESLPFVLLNARITKKSFNRWSIMRNFASQLIGSLSISISSNKETVNYLSYFNAKNVKYFGNIKFCSSVNKVKNFESNHFDQISKKKIWCAVSTHPGEEIFCGKVHKIIKKSNNKVMTIIIPRHVHRTKKIFSNLKSMELKVQIKNQNDLIDGSADVVLVNYYGSVTKYLNKIKQVFIGKSLLKKLKSVGGQNPIDAAKMGCHIFHGPYVYNFQEIYDYLDSKNISEKINKPEILAEKLIKNFNTSSKENDKNIEKLSSYSDEIFKNVIQEYNRFIT
tara:strand:- start:1281 stop:2549 length:1269 start_codon:yes stop_codon:yes gene_type:complete